MNELVETLREQWRANPRLRIGAWVIILILLVNLNLTLAELKQDRRLDFAQASGRLEQLQRLAGQDVWYSRATEASSMRAVWADRLWTTQSRGLAQATMDELVRNALSSTGAENLQVDISDAVEVDQKSSIFEVRTTLSAVMTRQGLLGLLHALETQPKVTRVEQMDVLRTQNDSLYVSLLISAFFTIEETAGVAR